MRSGIRGLLAGALALVALHTLVSTGASRRVSGLLQVPGAIAVRFLDPTVPAIPDRGAAPEPGPPGLKAVTPAPRRYPNPFLTGAPRPTAPGGD